MKCHRLLCITLVLAAAVSLAHADKSIDEAEHRAAKPEPFLDRLASALFGSSTDKKSEQKKVGQRPPRPVYNKRPPPYKLNAQPSFQTPVVAQPPQNSYGAPQAPPITSNNLVPQRRPQPQYKPSASNSFPSYFNGGNGGGGPQPGRNQ